MSYGTPFVKATPVLCLQASWPMLGWRAVNGHVSTPDLNISEITTQWVLGGRLVKFLLISPREGLDWTAETKSVACCVARYGQVQPSASPKGPGGR